MYKTTRDEDGNVLETDKKSFSDKESMDNYKERDENASSYQLDNINPGDPMYYVTYSQIEIGLRFYKVSSTRYYVYSMFNWLTDPGWDLFYKTRGIFGLALGPQLSIDGTTYSGYVAYNYLGNAYSTFPSVKANGTEGIGYSFVYDNAGGMSDLRGSISCYANVTSSTALCCSAYTEYDDVHTSLDISGFTVSLGDISVGLATTRTRYPAQDTLMFN